MPALLLCVVILSKYSADRPQTPRFLPLQGRGCSHYLVVYETTATPELGSVDISCLEFKVLPDGSLVLKNKLESVIGEVKQPRVSLLLDTGHGSVDYLIRADSVDHENNVVVGLNQHSGSLAILWRSDPHSYLRLVRNAAGSRIIREVWELKAGETLPGYTATPRADRSLPRVLYRDFALNRKSGAYECVRSFYRPPR